MSGGSMNYAFHYINDMAHYVDDKEIKDLMNDLSELMHDLEWWQSGDYSRGTYEETLAGFKKKWLGAKDDNRLHRIEKYINESLDEMKVEIGRILGE